MTPLRLLIVDDQALVRAGFRKLLESEDGFEVVGEAGDGVEAVAAARRLGPDVVLMDIRMPRLDGIEATRQLATGGRPAVLILTTYDLDEYVFEALRAGASGFLLKDAPPDDLVAAVRTVARGEALLAPSVTRRLIAEFTSRRRPDPGAALPSLSQRETEVLKLVARGMSNAEIARELYLGEATVKTHVGSLLAKLQCRDRVQAVVRAYESGLVTPGRSDDE
ncbi:MAG TPA: response regulator transcription factor [Nocardioides sp.]|uniref:response regulator transcription factor n=1 Tax=Nocardioides sp. TaxID=35761 RepID=UPI002E338017|nr:response regulator transcription factor [Nocardioides sp.]HEX5086528.1 response regulator transcription factor [Nocardioides sp.]